MLARAPELGQREAVIGINKRRDGLLKLGLCHVALVNPGHLAPVEGFERARGLCGTEPAAVAERGGHIASASLLDLRVMARERAEETCPVEPDLGVGQYIEDVDGVHPLADEWLKHLELARHGAPFEPTQYRLPVLETYRRVRGEGGVCGFGRGLKPRPRVLYEGVSCDRQPHLLTIVGDRLLILLP